MKRVVKRHLLGARIRENAAKTRGEGVVQTIIGPESEDTAGAQMCGKPGEPLLAVESGVLRIEQKGGGMIDVHEHCVKSAGGDGRIKARFGRREGEEIALNEAAPEVAGQLGCAPDYKPPIIARRLNSFRGRRMAIPVGLAHWRPS